MKISKYVGRFMMLVPVAITIASGVASAQPVPDDAAIARLRGALKPRDTISIRMQTGEEIRGRYLDATSGELVIATGNGNRRIAASGIDRVKRHKGGVALGGFIGGAIGAACGAALGMELSNEGGGAGGAMAGLTALGVGVGMLVDAAVNIPRTVYTRGSTQTSVALSAGPQRGSVGITIAFN